MFNQLRDTYATSFAPGTVQNRTVQAKTFVAFMISYDFSIFNPEVIDLLMYIQLLMNSLRSPQSVKNYVSGARTFVCERGGNLSAFNSYMVIKMLKGHTKRSTHIPRPSPPVSVPVLVRACSWLRHHSTEGEITAAALMFGMTTFLRQCHFLYTRTGAMHLIPRSDLLFYQDRIVVVMRSSKTTALSHKKFITILRNPAQGICPVHLLNQALQMVPAPAESAIFLHPTSRRVISASRTLEMFRLALMAVGFRNWGNITLHSLRRSGPHACISAGAQIEEIRQHGGWRSNAINAYLPSGAPTETPATLQGLIAAQADI